jgi:hypothetical protein
MELVRMDRWCITVDRAATILAHSNMPSGGANACTCCWCKNFTRQKPVPYPPEFVSLLERLGIDPNKEVEVYELDDDNGTLMYAGWFHFVGHTDGEEVQNIDPTEFTYYTMEGPATNLEQFQGLPVSRVEFFGLRLPWVDGLGPGST